LALSSELEYLPHKHQSQEIPELTSKAWLTSYESAPYVANAGNLFELYSRAKQICEGVEDTQLRLAVVEAVRVLSSGLFDDFLKPRVSIDEHGEFSFSLQTGAGYLDIGVRGDRELSYHVRNDKFPEETVYNDVEWDELSLPDELVLSVIRFVNS